MAAIFISYRREDSSGWATGLARTLKDKFGDNNVFFDLKARPGVDYVEEIERRLGASKVALVVIGPNWLAAKDGKGERRLDNPSDLTRTEVAQALSRKIAVIPVLVGGADMPSAGELPEDLRPLVRRNAHELTDRRWEYDQDELIDGIKFHLGDAAVVKPTPAPPPPPEAPSPFARIFGALTGQNRYLIWAIGGAVLAVVFGTILTAALQSGSSSQISRGQQFDPKLSTSPPPRFSNEPANMAAPPTPGKFAR